MKANDLRKGKLVSHEGELYRVHNARHVAKGNKRSYMQVELKSLKTGLVNDVRFSVDDRVETPFIDNKPYEFLYKDGDAYVLMEQETFEQIHVEAEMMDDADKYLKGNETVLIGIVDGKVVTTELPNVVELQVKETTPAIKGATVTNQTKDAELETGYTVKVPPFIENGETIRIDTRTGEYLERAKG